MPQQKTFRLPGKGAGYNALEEKTEDVPKPRPHEVLLKVHASTLNCSSSATIDLDSPLTDDADRDLAITTGAYPFPVKDNVVPFSDGAGTIVDVGEAVSDLAKGDWAIANFDITNMYGPQKDWSNGLGGPIDGVLREYVAIPAAAIVKIPKTTTLSWGHLASLVCTGTTVWNALYGNLPLKPGQTILCIGTGGVSMTATIFAKVAGARVIITSSSDEKLKLAREKYGADIGVNYKKTPNWSEEVNKITEGRGVDFVIENGGAGTIEQSIGCTARGGIVSVIGFLAPPEKMPDVATLVLGTGCVVRGINVGAKQLTEDMARFACANNLAIPIDQTFGFSRDGVVKAFKSMEEAGHVGKICIEISK